MHILPKKWITILRTKLVTISEDVDKIAEFPNKIDAIIPCDSI